MHILSSENKKLYNGYYMKHCVHVMATGRQDDFLARMCEEAKLSERKLNNENVNIAKLNIAALSNLKSNV